MSDFALALTAFVVIVLGFIGLMAWLIYWETHSD